MKCHNLLCLTEPTGFVNLLLLPNANNKLIKKRPSLLVGSDGRYDLLANLSTRPVGYICGNIRMNSFGICSPGSEGGPLFEPPPSASQA